MDNVRRMEKATSRREEKGTEDKSSTYRSPIKHDTHVIGPGWTFDINWQDSSKRVGNPKTSRKESDVAVTLHVSKVGQRMRGERPSKRHL